MYGKLFAQTFSGTLFGTSLEVFAVWAYVVAHVRDSQVELNPALLAATFATERKRIEDAIEFLCSPDPHSRNQDEEGRRLVKNGPFQYRVVSHDIYRNMRNEEDRKEYNRVKKAESRERQKAS